MKLIENIKPVRTRKHLYRQKILYWGIEHDKSVFRVYTNYVLWNKYEAVLDCKYLTGSYDIGSVKILLGRTRGSLFNRAVENPGFSSMYRTRYELLSERFSTFYLN